MNKHWGITFLMTALLFGLSGCQLARTDLQEEAQADRLIGMYITQEYLDLFDSEKYFNDHMGQLMSGKNLVVDEAESRAYENRIYAVYQETGKGPGEFVFEGLDGICFFSAKQPGSGDVTFSLQADEEVTDIKAGVSDLGQELAGTIYCPTDRNASFFCNPVYQTADGEVYLLAGTGISGNLTDGASLSKRMDESRTTKENGEETTEKSTVSITICGQDAYSCHVIAQMDAQDQKLQESAYPAEEVPDSITVPANTAYLICTSYQTGSDGRETVSRQIVELSEKMDFPLFVPGEKGLSVQKQVLVERAEGEGSLPAVQSTPDDAAKERGKFDA